MLDECSSCVDTAIQDTSFSEYLADAQPLADALLTTLSSFDLEYEQELERIRLSSSTQAVKNRVMYRVQERHRARREPYIQHLAQLRSRSASYP